MHLISHRMKNFSDKGCRKNKYFLKKTMPFEAYSIKSSKGYSLQYGACVLHVG